MKRAFFVSFRAKVHKEYPFYAGYWSCSYVGLHNTPGVSLCFSDFELYIQLSYCICQWSQMIPLPLILFKFLLWKMERYCSREQNIGCNNFLKRGWLLKYLGRNAKWKMRTAWTAIQCLQSCVSKNQKLRNHKNKQHIHHFMRSVPYFKSWKQYRLKYWCGGGTFLLQSNEPMNFSPLFLICWALVQEKGWRAKRGRDQCYTALRSRVAMGLYGGTAKLVMAPGWCQSKVEEMSLAVAGACGATQCFFQQWDSHFSATWRWGSQHLGTISFVLHTSQRRCCHGLSFSCLQRKMPEDLYWTETNLPGSLAHALNWPFWFEE